MNTSVQTLLRVITLLLIVVLTMSMVACDKLPFDIEGILGGNGENVEGGNTDGEIGDNTDDGENEEHTHNFVDGKCECGESDPSYVPPHTHDFVNGKCECGEDDPSYVPPHTHDFVNGKCECGEIDPEHTHSFVDGKCECGLELEVPPELKTITIAEAIALCEQYPGGTTERYYIRATVKTVSNVSYGEMIIQDETGELYVYGTYSEDGELYFNQLTDRPVKGDEVLLYCILSQHNGSNQVKNARLIEFTHNEPDIDLSKYTEMTLADAREAATDTLVKVSGVVAQITYANGRIPSGVILVDGTSSIYVHGTDVAGQVQIGNTIEVAASKTYWILDDEKGNAEKFGYQGSCQLDDAILLSNDKEVSDFDKSWIAETAIKNILDTPVSENFTNKIFKVNALVSKVEGTGFVNYYFNDIDGVTGSYTYTQCNGSDFGWLDEFDGKICTVYIVVQNAKSTSSGCVFRFLPIEVIDEGYKFDTSKAGEYAVKYHGVTQFLSMYTGDPELKLQTLVSSELLGFENATLSFASSDEEVLYFTTDENGDIIFHCKKSGTVNVIVTGKYGEIEYSESVEITVDIPEEEVQYSTVIDAINAANNTSVTVKGIVGPSLVNQVGFYLIDAGGAIAVKVSAEIMATVEIGHEVVISGTRTITKDGGGQICIENGTVLVNNYGSHDYATDSFITGKTISEIYATTDSAEATTKVFVTSAKIFVNESYYSVTVQVQDPNKTSTYVLLYSGGKDQYNWLKGYNGQTVTIELALCDWNAKGLKGCVLAVVNDDGSKVLNTLNFN